MKKKIIKRIFSQSPTITNPNLKKKEEDINLLYFLLRFSFFVKYIKYDI